MVAFFFHGSGAVPLNNRHTFLPTMLTYMHANRSLIHTHTHSYPFIFYSTAILDE